MRFFETLKNIFSIEELRKRIIFTVALIAIYRLGSYIVLPGADVDALQNAVQNSGNSNDLLGLLNLFTGGAFNNASIMALGIMPYITASIIVQLLGFAVPYFQKLQSKEGESGRKKLNQITRALTVAITLVQGAGYLTYIRSNGGMSAAVEPSVFWISGIVILSTGTIFAMWLGERITDRGIGNGVSLLITVGIIATLPKALGFEFQSKFSSGGPLIFIIEMFAYFAVTMLTVMVVTGVRKIPLQFAKRSVGRGEAAAPTTTNRDYIPLKVNASGVMPIIFAQALMLLPVSLAGFGSSDAQSSWLVQQFNDFTSPIYNIVYFLLVVVFTYVYTALVVNPGQYTEYLRRQNAFIPGVRGGVETEEYIDSITSRITLPGSIILGLIAILPALAATLGVNQAFAIFFGGTSLIIMVGVVLDTLQQIESYLLMKKYDGLVKEGRIEGRGGGSRMQSLGADF
ncbi:preprotein translocase subunit SecY [Neolewinella lacunae]|uniref:Protein translocase subunit SecY n=1 Tax=Neolewinella lacunae TaxID=1517758 RepID=A0A923PFE3_9BACT|nr:preprotein translocase subunit SecY [Neolewinella lacunae]MBC6993062.1 preprotein translocase subunit SecY [Neolewinella lacunae]MDN3635884.1 preprotein translocase subunit SecY [Neolewinella lacunae]